MERVLEYRWPAIGYPGTLSRMRATSLFLCLSLLLSVIGPQPAAAGRPPLPPQIQAVFSAQTLTLFSDWIRPYSPAEASRLRRQLSRGVDRMEPFLPVIAVAAGWGVTLALYASGLSAHAKALGAIAVQSGSWAVATVHLDSEPGGSLARVFAGLRDQGPLTADELIERLALSKDQVLRNLRRLDLLGEKGIRLLSVSPAGLLLRGQERRYALSGTARAAAPAILAILTRLPMKGLTRDKLLAHQPDVQAALRAQLPPEPDANPEPGSPLTPDAARAERRLNALLLEPGDAPALPLQDVSSDPTRTAGVHIGPFGDSEAYEMLPFDWQLMREAAWDDVNDCAALIGYHLGEDGRPDLHQPLGWILLYRTSAGTRLRIRHADGTVTDEPANRVESRQRELAPYPAFQRFTDSLRLPRETAPGLYRPGEVRALGRWLRDYGFQDRLSAGMIGGIELSGLERLEGRFLTWADRGYDSRAIAWLPRDTGVSEAGEGFVVFRRPGDDTALALVHFDGTSEVLTAQNRSLSGVAANLSGTQVVRDMQKAGGQSFVRREFKDGTVRVGIGSAFVFFNFTVPMVVVRRTGEVSRKEGPETNRLFVLRADAPVLKDPAFAGLAEGLPLGADAQERLASAALLEISAAQSTPEEPGDEVFVRVQGEDRPAVTLRAFATAGYKYAVFTGHLALQALRASAPGEDRPALDHLLSLIGPTNWQGLRDGDELIRWKTPGRTPWLVRAADVKRAKDDPDFAEAFPLSRFSGREVLSAPAPVEDLPPPLQAAEAALRAACEPGSPSDLSQISRPIPIGGVGSRFAQLRVPSGGRPKYLYAQFPSDLQSRLREALLPEGADELAVGIYDGGNADGARRWLLIIPDGNRLRLRVGDASGATFEQFYSRNVDAREQGLTMARTQALDRLLDRPADAQTPAAPAEHFNTVYSRAQVIAELLRRHADGGYEALRKMNITDSLYDAARHRFGSYRRAIERAGLDPLQVPGMPLYEETLTRDFVLREIKRLGAAGVSLSITGVKRAGFKPLHDAATRLWKVGGWGAAVTDAGFDYDAIREKKRWSAKSVIADIQRQHKDKEDISATGVKKRGLESLYIAGVRYFGTWAAAVEAAGIPYAAVRRTLLWSEDEVKAQLQARMDARKDLNARAILSENPKLYQAAWIYFGGTSAALEAMGHDPRLVRRQYGFGRVMRSFLEERLFADALRAELIRAGLQRSMASRAANALSRMRGDSLRLLVQEGVLDDGMREALLALDLEAVRPAELSRALARTIGTYRDHDLGFPRIARIMSTHVIPWSFIERMQRTYRLGRTLELVMEALSHPDLEAWIRRARETQEARGTLNVSQSLDRYEAQPADPKAAESWLAEFRERRDTLSALLRASPEAVHRTYEQRSATAQAVVIRVSQWSPEFRRGQTLLLGDHVAAEIQGVDAAGGLLTLKVPAGTTVPSSGALLLATSDRPLEIQLRLLSEMIGQLERTRSTGRPAIDRVLGIAPLTSDPLVPAVKRWFNKKIPYRKTGEVESVGDQSQEMAVRLALSKTQVELIEGPPGTGKTTVIAEIVRQAVAAGKRVLVVSQMHQAVDNALAEFMDDPEVPCLRVGNRPEGFAYGTQKVWAGDAKALETFQRRRLPGRGMVIAGTTMGVATERAVGLSERDFEFDLVLMDEGSRETLPGALVPLSYLKRDGKAIIVGDIQQLPPFGVTESQRRAAGLTEAQAALHNTSVLEQLLRRRHGDRVMLSTNYRSHPLIAGLVSHLFYNGLIHRRGWEDFTADTLNLRVINIGERGSGWHERKVGTSYQNERSAEEVVSAVRRYVERGIALPDITIVTPYQPQVDLLTQRLRDVFGEVLPHVTTIDGYQGGENDAIIFDFVRSNKDGEIGFVKDLRRVNVALSRAKNNLSIIWDSRTFLGEPRNPRPEDEAARELFQDLGAFYEEEVLTFYPEESDDSLAALSALWERTGVTDRMRSRGLSDQGIARILALVEEAVLTGLVVVLQAAGIADLGTASVVSLALFALAHVPGAMRLSAEGRLSVSPASQRRRDLLSLTAAAALLRTAVGALLHTSMPGAPLLAMAAAMIVHERFNARVARSARLTAAA